MQSDTIVDLHDLRRRKRAWRAWARTRRDDVDVASWSAAVRSVLASWPPFDDARVVGGYRAIGYEANLDPSLVHDPRVVYPRTTRGVDDAGWITTWATPRQALARDEVDAGFVRHALGMLQPDDEAATVDPRTVDVVLVPGMAFDAHGTRLGRGGGQYDRLLAERRPDTLLVGIAHPATWTDERLPREAHDVAMTHLIVGDHVVAVPTNGGAGTGLRRD